VLVLSAVELSAGEAGAWLVEGHQWVTIDAVGRLPAEVPAFFRAGAATVGHAAVDPDLWRNHGTPALAEREAPEHYIDLELLGGAPLPAERDQYLRLLGRLGVEPRKAGALPYAIVEEAEQLALAFAEHRRWPADETIRSKCLLQAGWLAHFAGDLTQPLHTTVHHDGRTLPNGEPPYTGIHRKVDSLFERLWERGERPSRPADGPGTVPDLVAAVRAELAVSHSLVDAVYRLEVPILEGGGTADPRVAAFAGERYAAARRFIAEVLLWSWRRSAEIELPGWLAR